ncbi:MAG: hypothetical protein AB1444_16315 [Spirochaetota bacterium]
MKINKVVLILIYSISIAIALYQISLYADIKKVKNLEINYWKGKIYAIYVYDNTEIDDNGLKVLNEVGETLELLGITKSNITDKGIKHIVTLKKLRILGIGDCELTDRGMEYIGELENLEELDISNTKVTDEGLKHIKGLKKLRTLIVSNTMITGEGFKYLQDLNIEELAAANTMITDDSLQYLQNMQLQLLTIPGTRVSDKGIQYLEKMKSLEKLLIWNTKISARGVKTLKSKLPHTMIVDKKGHSL